MSFQNTLIDLLKSDSRFVDTEGNLVIAAVQDCAWHSDRELVRHLLSDSQVKSKFFEEIEGYLVFRANLFIQYISMKNFLADSYTRFRSGIGLTVGGRYLRERGEVALVWPFKDSLLEGGQTKDQEKRKEIFFNELLAEDEITRLLDPKVLTGFARYSAEGRQPVNELKRDERGVLRENLIIKGNNLLSLHVLKTQFRGQVRCIYIDPPYNPDSRSNTFQYNNNFNRSTWLTFMKNRLEVAKQLLCKDGVLIVAIDDNEQAYLGVLLKELFSEYEIHCITIVHNPRGVQGENFSYTHEYAFFVFPQGAKVIGKKKVSQDDIDWSNLRNWGGESQREDARNCFYSVRVRDGMVVGFGDVLDDNEHPQTQTVQVGGESLVYPIDKNRIERKWRYSRQSVADVAHLLRAKKTADGYEIEIGKDFGTYRTVWEDPRYDASIYGTQLVRTLVPGSTFDFPKSLWNVYDCLYAVAAEDKNAIVLDFFAGSGTTAHAVLELNKDGGNRTFILCEQMDYVETVTTERVRRVIEQRKTGDLVYFELLKSNETFMERIQSTKTSDELLKVWQDMAESSFLNWYVSPKTPEEAIGYFQAIGCEEDGLEKQKRLLASLLDKNQLYVNLTEIDDAQFNVSQQDKALNREFYGEGYNA